MTKTVLGEESRWPNGLRRLIQSAVFLHFNIENDVFGLVFTCFDFKFSFADDMGL